MSTHEYAAVQFLAFADQETRLVCGLTDGSILMYDSSGNGPVGRAAPPTAGAHLVGVIPNPGDRSELCVALYAAAPAAASGGTCHLLDMRSGSWVASLPESGVTSAAWSTKGKQLVLGLRTGELVQCTTEGEVKARLAPPPDADRPLLVEDVRWLENHVFIVTYNTVSEEMVHEYDVFVVLRDPKSQSCTYAAFPLDVAPPFGDVGRAGRRYIAALRAWDREKHLVFMANTPSTDVGVLDCKADASGPSAWNALELEDTSRPALPFSSTDDASDTAPIGLEFDLTASDPVDDPNAAAKGEDTSTKLPAMPILLVYTNDGVLLAYHVINTDTSEPYPGMVTPGTGPSSSDSTPASQPSTAVPQAAPATPAFGAPASSSKPAFGSVSQPSSTPAFGAPSAFGASKPAFGSTSGFGASAFGNASTSTSSTGGFSAFGGGASAFGSANSGLKPANAFGSTATPSAFGSGSSTPAFGSTSTPSAFGKPAFGQSSAFGSQAAVPSAFGSTASSTAFGQPSGFGSAPAFGKTAAAPASGSAFSAMAGKPTGFGAVSNTNGASVFGSGESLDKGKPAFEGVKPAPKKETAGEESSMDAEPLDNASQGAFSFGSMGDLMGSTAKKEADANKEKQSATFGFAASANAPSAGFSFGQKKDETQTEPSKSSPFSFTKPESTGGSASAFSFAKPETKQGENNKPAETPTFSFGQQKENTTPTSDDASSSASKGTASAQDASPAKETQQHGAPSPPMTKPDQEKPKDASAFSFAKPEAEQKESNDAKPTTPFSFAKPNETASQGNDEAKKSPFSFAKPDGKKEIGDPPSFSFAKPEKEDDKPSTPAFSFAKPEDKKEEGKSSTPAFSFAKPEDKKEGKPSTPAFSFTKPEKEDGKPNTPSTSFVRSDEKEEGKLSKPAFSFAKSDDKKEEAKPSTPTFSFANKTEDKKEDAKSSAPTFFAKSEDKKEENKSSAAAFSFAKPEDKKEDTKPSTPAFSFARPEEKEGGKSSKQAFSFAKPEDKKEDTKPSAPVFSFARSEDKKEDVKPGAPSFSFAKSEDKKESSPFSFAKPQEKGGDSKPTAFSSFAKPGDSKASPFSFAKPKSDEAATKAMPQGDAKEPVTDMSAKNSSNDQPKDQRELGYAPKSTEVSKVEVVSEPAKESKGQKEMVAKLEAGASDDRFENVQPEAVAQQESPLTPTEEAKPNETSSGASTTPVKAPTTHASKPTSGFSFAAPHDGGAAKQASAFLFAQPNRGEKAGGAAPAFSFAKSDDAPKPNSAFSFAKPETPTKPAFSLAKTDDKGGNEKPAGAFSFVNPESTTPKATPSFSFAKPADAQESKAPFFASKPADKTPAQETKPKTDAAPTPHSSSSARSSSVDAPTADTKQGGPAFSFGKPTDAVPAASAPAWKTTSAAAAPGKTAAPTAPARAQGTPLRDVRVPKVHLPSVPTPDVSGENGELQREFVKVYLSVNAELRALHERANELGRFVDEVQQCGSEKHVDDLQDPASWTFGDLPSLASVAHALQTSIVDTERAVAESQQRVASIQSVQLKAEIKRDEAARFLRARKDPSFAKLVHVRHLGPEHMENQQRLRRTTHMVRERMQELEDYLHTIKTTVANDKSGRSSLRPPSLDSVYRSAEHISTLAARRLAELDRLGAELKELRPDAATPAPLSDESRMTTPRKTSTALDSLHDLHTTLPEATEADSEAEWAAHVAAMDTVLQVRTTPVVTEATASNMRAEGIDAPVVLHRAPLREATPPPPALAPAAPTAAPADPGPKPMRPDFLATKTPDGVRAPTPQACTVAHVPAHGSAAVPATHASSGPTYTTFEGLVPPRPVSPPQDLTLEQYVEQEESDGYEDDDEFDDYGEDEDEEDDYDEDDDEDYEAEEA